MARRQEAGEDKLRIAIVNSDRCKPSRCQRECKSVCPSEKQGKLCVEVARESDVARIAESLCSGCGMCVKRCPFKAIEIINLPRDLRRDATHRYGLNGFKLHRLPVPRPGQVLGLVGANGTGKSTALAVLAGRLKPNLGRHDDPPDWKEIIAHFRGSELQMYFKRMSEGQQSVVIKPQFVDKIERAFEGKVGEILSAMDSRGVKEEYMRELELSHLQERAVEDLSGGEKQRFAIAVTCMQDAQVYMFDEPSSYLDVKQRLNAARVIRSLQRSDNYIIVVEHDLAVLDYMSDYICCMWGEPGAYGVVTVPMSVLKGINVYLDGYLPCANLRFREALTFNVAQGEVDSRQIERTHKTEYPAMSVALGESFGLDVRAGDFSDSEVIVMLGQNGTGKTTFIKMLAGRLKPGAVEVGKGMPELRVSYKPQILSLKFQGTVRQFLQAKINNAFQDPQFQTDVVGPMLIEIIADKQVQTLSGGELQRVAVVRALGEAADLYLIDEPSAYLDVEQRVAAARVLRRFIMRHKKTAFIVEHDFLMATYMADRVVVYDGEPGQHCVASPPMALFEGMNSFLQQLHVTFRRDAKNLRPRINKLNGVKDREQKAAGCYFLVEE